MKTIGFTTLMLLGINVFCQNLSVNNTYPRNQPLWLAQHLVGPNLSVFAPIGPNGTPIWQPTSTQIATFQNTNPIFGLDSGIVLVTSDAIDVVCGQSGSFTTSPIQTPSSTLTGILNQLGSSSSALYDKASIEFSFVSPNDSIELEYIFASKEYTSYTCSQYNDVFGIFLIGQGINGQPLWNANGSPNIDTVNLAVITGNSIPVAVNTINQGFPSSNGNASNCLAANPNYVANSVMYNANTGGTSIINMEGYTDAFKAKANVICGNIYTLRIEIADNADGNFNSAVFLGHSFYSLPKINLELDYGNNDSLLYEGCNDVKFIVSREGALQDSCFMSFNLSGNAINGVDYSGMPTSISLMPFQTSDTIFISGIDDGIFEGIDTLNIMMQPVTTNCAVYPAQYRQIYISDKTSLQHTTSVILGQSNSSWIANLDTTVYYLFPKDYDNVQWTVSGGLIIGPDNEDSVTVFWNTLDTSGIITAKTYKNQCWDSISYQIYVSQIGLTEGDNEFEAIIAPNPNDGYFTLEVEESIVGSEYVLIDELGRLIEKGKIESTSQDFDLLSKPKGVYRLSIKSTNGIKTMAVVVQ